MSEIEQPTEAQPAASVDDAPQTEQTAWDAFTQPLLDEADQAPLPWHDAPEFQQAVAARTDEMILEHLNEMFAQASPEEQQAIAQALYEADQELQAELAFQRAVEGADEEVARQMLEEQVQRLDGELYLQGNEHLAALKQEFGDFNWDDAWAIAGGLAADADFKREHDGPNGALATAAFRAAAESLTAADNEYEAAKRFAVRLRAGDAYPPAPPGPELEQRSEAARAQSTQIIRDALATDQEFAEEHGDGRPGSEKTRQAAHRMATESLEPAKDEFESITRTGTRQRAERIIRAAMREPL